MIKRLVSWFKGLFRKSVGERWVDIKPKKRVFNVGDREKLEENLTYKQKRDLWLHMNGYTVGDQRPKKIKRKRKEIKSPYFWAVKWFRELKAVDEIVLLGGRDRYGIPKYKLKEEFSE